MGTNSSFPDLIKDAVPDSEPRPILLRAYAEAPASKQSNPKDLLSEEFTLIFDTETFADETQRLRFGTYQVLKGTRIREKGIFYGDVESDELDILKAEAPKHGCKLITVYEFIHKKFFKIAFKVGGLVVGFNLPFDLSRLAIGHNDSRVVRPGRSKAEILAQAPLKKADRFMKGGFSFTLSPFNDQPPLRIKHQNGRSAFFSFAQPKINEATTGQRRKGRGPKFQRGNFLDVKTLAACLTATSHSLDSLAKFLSVDHKTDFKDFDRAIDSEFVEYAINDTEVTKQCYLELKRRYDLHGLKRTQAHRIYSEAGLGRAYLKEMGIKSWREVQKDFDPHLIGAIMSSYFGGRAEVHIRRTVVPTIYCDFASMYPTVCTLMALWRFVIAQGIETKDATQKTWQFLEQIDLAQLQDPQIWKSLTTLVQVLPEADIFPVRARYAPKIEGSPKSSDMSTIGLNYLSSDQPLWFTLADCVSSKLLTGKAPKIIKAIHFSPKAPQENLKAVAVGGNPEFKVKPVTDDFYKRVIELRRRVKIEAGEAERKDPNSQEFKNFDMEQLGLKILANATSYGIFIQLDSEETDDNNHPLKIYTWQGERDVKVSKLEKPGPYFHPLLGTLITGAARLMLAITEKQAFEHGLNWAFCDTDSMAFANLNNLRFEDFSTRVKEICNWFVPLNPYVQDEAEEPVSILELEKQNFSKMNKKDLDELYCFAISAKRYAMFNKDVDGNPLVRKASAHALGHYASPYGTEGEVRSDSGIGVRVWEEDVWKQILKAALSDSSKVEYGYRPEMTFPARSQYSATRPAVLDWFNLFNKGRAYPEQVKPFNFMLSYYAHRQEDLIEEGSDRDWDPRMKDIRPVSPYSKDISKALPHIFNRNSDQFEHVPVEWLRSVAHVLRDYHRQPEYKFLGGGWNEAGILRRRHVHAEFIQDIGKESTDWEEDDARKEEQDLVISYPSSPIDRENKIKQIMSVPKVKLKVACKIAMRTIDAVHAGDPSISETDINRMFNAAMRLKQRAEKAGLKIDDALRWLRQRHSQIGLAAVATELSEDKANLAKVIKKQRNMSEMLLSKVRSQRGTVDEKNKKA